MDVRTVNDAVLSQAWVSNLCISLVSGYNRYEVDDVWMFEQSNDAGFSQARVNNLCISLFSGYKRSEGEVWTVPNDAVLSEAWVSNL